jgi:hypothetical protein
MERQGLKESVIINMCNPITVKIEDYSQLNGFYIYSDKPEFVDTDFSAYSGVFIFKSYSEIERMLLIEPFQTILHNSLYEQNGVLCSRIVKFDSKSFSQFLGYSIPQDVFHDKTQALPDILCLRGEIMINNPKIGLELFSSVVINKYLIPQDNGQTLPQRKES